MPTNDEAFDQQLTTLLAQRADAITVTSDVGAVMADAPISTTAASNSRRVLPRVSWLAAAAVLIILSGAPLAKLPGPDPTYGGKIGAASASTAAVAQSPDTQTIVWLDPNASSEQITQIQADLQALTSPQAVTYIDKYQTWTEFKTHFADQPEILTLVEIEQLPTSFRLTALIHQSDIAAIEALPGVISVDPVERGLPN